MSANQPVRFNIVQPGRYRGGADGPGATSIVDPFPVTISAFTPSYNFGDGRDVKYSMTIQQWNPQGSGFEMNAPAAPGVYITKPGDEANCGRIAARVLHSLSMASNIRVLNKAVLAADLHKRTALKKQNSSVDLKLITPGTRLKMPAAPKAVGATPDRGAPI